MSSSSATKRSLDVGPGEDAHKRPRPDNTSSSSPFASYNGLPSPSRALSAPPRVVNRLLEASSSLGSPDQSYSGRRRDDDHGDRDATDVSHQSVPPTASAHPHADESSSLLTAISGISLDPGLRADAAEGGASSRARVRKRTDQDDGEATDDSGAVYPRSRRRTSDAGNALASGGSSAAEEGISSQDNDGGDNNDGADGLGYDIESVDAESGRNSHGNQKNNAVDGDETEGMAQRRGVKRSYEQDLSSSVSSSAATESSSALIASSSSALPLTLSPKRRPLHSAFSPLPPFGLSSTPLAQSASASAAVTSAISARSSADAHGEGTSASCVYSVQPGRNIDASTAKITIAAIYQAKVSEAVRQAEAMLLSLGINASINASASLDIRSATTVVDGPIGSAAHCSSNASVDSSGYHAPVTNPASSSAAAASDSRSPSEVLQRQRHDAVAASVTTPQGLRSPDRGAISSSAGLSTSSASSPSPGLSNADRTTFNAPVHSSIGSSSSAMSVASGGSGGGTPRGRAQTKKHGPESPLPASASSVSAVAASSVKPPPLLSAPLTGAPSSASKSGAIATSASQAAPMQVNRFVHICVSSSPSSTSSSPSLIGVDQLFTLFAVYGNVHRIGSVSSAEAGGRGDNAGVTIPSMIVSGKGDPAGGRAILPHASSSAPGSSSAAAAAHSGTYKYWLEYSVPEGAEMAARNLNGLSFGWPADNASASATGGVIVTLSLAVRRAVAAEVGLIACVASWKDFSRSADNRYNRLPGPGTGGWHGLGGGSGGGVGGERGADVPKHPCAPSATLHIANLPDPPPSSSSSSGVEAVSAHRSRVEAQLQVAFAPYGPVVAVRFPPNSTRMAFVGLPSAGHATRALMQLHNNAFVAGRKLRISFTAGSAT